MKKPINLLIDAVSISSPGILQLKHELITSAVKKMSLGSRIIILQDKDHNILKPSERVIIRNMKKPSLAWIGRWYWYNRTLPGKIKEYNADVFYSLSGILSNAICSKAGSIITINNMIPFTPKQMNHFPIFSLGYMRLFLLRRIYTKSARMADALILHSRHAFENISRIAGNIKDKSFVVLTGVPRLINLETKKHQPHPYNKKPYMFAYSTIHWYKNYINLIKAYRRALTENERLPHLIIAGYPKDRDYVKKMQKEIEKNDLNMHVKYIGSLLNEQIPACIYNADVNFTSEAFSFWGFDVPGTGSIQRGTAPPPEGGTPQTTEPAEGGDELDNILFGAP